MATIETITNVVMSEFDKQFPTVPSSVDTSSRGEMFANIGLVKSNIVPNHAYYYISLHEDISGKVGEFRIGNTE